MTGIAQVGQSLTLTTGSWSNTPTSYTRQWTRCDTGGASCGDIGGATAATYLLVAADQGSTIRVRVTASNAAGQGTPATSTQTAVVVAAPPGVPVNSGLPVVSGTAQQGQTLSASSGSLLNISTGYGYQWRRCNPSGAACADIGSATASTYLLQAADVGSTLRVRVIASNAGGPDTRRLHPNHHRHSPTTVCAGQHGVAGRLGYRAGRGQTLSDRPGAGRTAPPRMRGSGHAVTAAAAAVSISTGQLQRRICSSQPTRDPRSECG